MPIDLAAAEGTGRATVGRLRSRLANTPADSPLRAALARAADEAERQLGRVQGAQGAPTGKGQIITLPDRPDEPLAEVLLPDHLSEQSRTTFIRGAARLLNTLNSPTVKGAEKDRARREMIQFRGALARAGGRLNIITNRYQTDPSTGEITGKIGYIDSSAPAGISAPTVTAPPAEPSPGGEGQPLSGGVPVGMGTRTVPPIVASQPAAAAPSQGSLIAQNMPTSYSGLPQTTPNLSLVSPPAGPAPSTALPSLAPSYEVIPQQIAAEVASRMERYSTGGVPAALDDQTALRPDSQNDIMERLTDAILNPRRNSDVHIPLSRGETIALGIIGGTDPDAFQNIVMPLVQSEFARNEKEADRRNRQSETEVAALQALAQLRETQVRDRQAALFQEAEIRNREGELAYHNRMADIAQQRADQMGGATKPPPAGIITSYEKIAGGAQAAQEAADLMDQNYGLLGGYPGGPVSGHLPGSDVRNQLSVRFGLINDAILAHFQRRGLGGSELVKYTTPYLLHITDRGGLLREKVRKAYSLLHESAESDRVLYPILRQPGIIHESGASMGTPAPPPGFVIDDSFDGEFDAE